MHPKDLIARIESTAPLHLAASWDKCGVQIASAAAEVKTMCVALDPTADALRRGNWLARTRMCVLYDLSARHRALVLGTSNRSELLVGYFTQYGDSACAFEPIGHLYKSEVWELARLLGIPDKIINKTPTADLWSGQSDEADLGLSYPVLDDILYALTELDVNAGASENLDHPAELYQKVDRMITNSAFKRKLPPVLED